jgi:RNA polymerase sigma-70 factor (ECF subfamily)
MNAEAPLGTDNGTSLDPPSPPSTPQSTTRSAAAAPQDAAELRLSALMHAAQDGDGAAYLALLEELTPFLRRVVKARMRFLQQADVEDLVQDALLSLHAARATYDPKRPFLPWLMVITHSRMVDGARRFGRRSKNEVLVDEMPVTFSEPESNVEANTYGDADVLRQEIGKLPQGQRKAVELLKLRELSLKEAAEVSGMSIASLKVSVHRAMKTLRSSKQLRQSLNAESKER